MKKIVALSFAALLVLGAMPALAGSAADGAAVFKAKCAMCHGADGKKVTADGKGKMPAYKSKLSADEITAVVAHIRSLAKK